MQRRDDHEKSVQADLRIKTIKVQVEKIHKELGDAEISIKCKQNEIDTLNFKREAINRETEELKNKLDEQTEENSLIQSDVELLRRENALFLEEYSFKMEQEIRLQDDEISSKERQLN